jgi:hypothetical protein
MGCDFYQAIQIPHHKAGNGGSEIATIPTHSRYP